MAVVRSISWRVCADCAKRPSDSSLISRRVASKLTIPTGTSTAIITAVTSHRSRCRRLAAFTLDS